MDEPICPECGARFFSWQKLRSHHISQHGKSLPNRQCESCDEWFFSKNEKKYCSSDCRPERPSQAGAANPNYRGGKTETECEICGATFRFYESEKPGLYCPTCVESEPWRPKQDISGEKNPRWNGGPVEVHCHMCGTTVKRQPSNVPDCEAFCSRACQADWLSETFTGEGHPNWRGGGRESYGRGWNRVRRQALERDDYQCVVCGTTKEELGRNPDVHHIIPVRAFIESPLLDKADAHYLENVASLCVECHRNAEYGNISPARLQWLIGAREIRGVSRSLAE